MVSLRAVFSSVLLSLRVACVFAKYRHEGAILGLGTPFLLEQGAGAVGRLPEKTISSRVVLSSRHDLEVVIACPEEKIDCGDLSHPEICCPAPPSSVCLETNNTNTGVYCCFSPDPLTQPCDDTKLECESGYYECPPKFNGGCCKFGQVCELTRCVKGIDNAPQKLEDIDQYYGILQNEEENSIGVGPDAQEDWLNDGERLGDEESRALEGARVTETLKSTSNATNSSPTLFEPSSAPSVEQETAGSAPHFVGALKLVLYLSIVVASTNAGLFI